MACKACQLSFLQLAAAVIEIVYTVHLQLLPTAMMATMTRLRTSAESIRSFPLAEQHLAAAVVRKARQQFSLLLLADCIQQAHVWGMKILSSELSYKVRIHSTGSSQ